MPDLYQAGASLLEGAANTANTMRGQDIEREKMASQEMQTGTAQRAETERQMSAQEAHQQLAKMEIEGRLKGEMITITPQLALGLTKNTGDKEWLKATGQSMRADVYTALYTHGMTLAQAKKAPKITQVYDKDGKVRHAVVYTDSDGTMQQLLLDAGMTPKDLHPNHPGRPGSGSSDPNFKKNQQFIKSFEAARKELADPIKAKEMKTLDPNGYAEKVQFLKDNQDPYDRLIKSMAAAGEPGAPAGGAAPAGGGDDSGDAPFDADAFIQEALK